eukprot:10408514-Karenia_brevis.AAC.1
MVQRDRSGASSLFAGANQRSKENVSFRYKQCQQRFGSRAEGYDKAASDCRQGNEVGIGPKGQSRE